MYSRFSEISQTRISEYSILYIGLSSEKRIPAIWLFEGDPEAIWNQGISFHRYLPRRYFFSRGTPWKDYTEFFGYKKMRIGRITREDYLRLI